MSEHLDDDELPRAYRPRQMLLPAIAAITVLAFVIWNLFIPFEGIEYACTARRSACPTVEAQVHVYAPGRIILEVPNEDCESRMYFRFSEGRTGAYYGSGMPVDEPGDSEDLRGTAPCSDFESLRWTWIGPRLR